MIIEKQDNFSIIIKKLEFYLSQISKYFNKSFILDPSTTVILICEILKKLMLKEDINQIVKENIKIFRNFQNFNYLGQAKIDCELIEELQVYEIQFRFVENTNELNFVFNDVSRTAIFEKQKSQLELKYKNMFLSKIAHEFKNPLISISEKLNTAKDLIKKLSPNEKHKILKIFTFINYIGIFLISIVKDMDIISQSHIQNIQLNITEFSLEDLVDFCVNITECLLELKDKKDKIIFNVEKDFPINFKLHSDEWKVKQILINLLSNSIKFTTHGQILLRVSVESLNDNYLVSFSVKDTGRGISEEAKKDLFKENNNRNNCDNLIGAGLGLTIVRDLVKILDAIIEYESQIGEGTTFKFSIVEKGSHESFYILQADKNNRRNELNSEEITVVSDFKPNDVILNVENVVPSREKSLNSSSSSHYSMKIQEEEIKEVFSPIIHIKKPLDNMQFDVLNFGLFITKYIRHLKTDKSSETHYLIVADDDKFTRQSNLRIIEDSARRLQIKVEIFQAEDGLECIYIVYKCLNEGIKISLIFSDETMYYMRGTKSYEIISEILTAKNIPHIPFILVTAYEELLHHSDNNFKVISKPLSKSNTEMALKLL